MNELEGTWSRATKVWWSIVWRAVLVSGLGGFIMQIILRFIVSGSEEQAMVLVITMVIAMVPVYIWATKQALNRSYSDFRLAVVPKEAEE